MRPPKPVALPFGGTGFVGRHLSPALRSLGFDVRVTTRDLQLAEAPLGSTLVQVDETSSDSMRAAMRGVRTLFYLVHQTGEAGYIAKESELALRTRDCAAEANMRSIVYLGGVAPESLASDHLAARLETGRILREGKVPTVELRAAMILGCGSASFELTRELVSIMPILPITTWTEFASAPVSIDDVALALAWAALLEAPESVWLDVHGGEIVTHRAMLNEVANALHQRRPALSVPFVSIGFAARVAGFISSQPAALVEALMRGLGSDLLPQRGAFDAMAQSLGCSNEDVRPISVRMAVRMALAEGDRVCASRPSLTTRKRIAARVRQVLHTRPNFDQIDQTFWQEATPDASAPLD
jgi:uncharacterized protein YbjT (DUF2867 family)